MAHVNDIHCSVITPEAKVFEGAADFVALPAHDGEIGVLPNRAPLLCKLGIGVLRVRRGDQVAQWFVDGGFAQVIANQLTVLTQRALQPQAIDPAAANRSLEEALRMEMRDDAARQARNDAVARAKTQLRLASGR